MLIRVFELPAEFSGAYCFGSGIPTNFQMVDWFRDDLGMMEGETGRSEIAEFIRGKRYIKPGRAYLVLHPKRSFTISYSAPWSTARRHPRPRPSRSVRRRRSRR